MTARLTIEYVREYVSKTDEILISKKYTGAHAKLVFQCPQGHLYKMTWTNFKRGSRCAECAGKGKKTIEHVRKEAEKDRTILVSKRYKNAHAKLEFQCLQGHRYRMTWTDFQQGVRCAECAVSGFNPKKPAILYYLEVLHRGRIYYKIGVTNRTVDKRYPPSDLKKITIIFEQHFEKGGDARDEEQLVIGKFSDCLYNGNATILDGATGNAELFTEDILQLRGEIFI